MADATIEKNSFTQQMKREQGTRHDRELRFLALMEVCSLDPLTLLVG